MKTLQTVLCFLALLLIPVLAVAQAGPVALKNGTGTVLSTYTTIQAAYNAIPVPLTQPYRIEIDGNNYTVQEHFPIVFTEKAGAGPNNVITIVPNAAKIPMYTNFTGRTDLSPLVIFDGAKWITFNGYRPGIFPVAMNFIHNEYNSTVSNLPRAVYPLISFINGAKHNKLMYCSFSNASDDFDASDEAAIIFGGTNNTAGNDSNTVINCEFLYADNMMSSNGNSAYPNAGLLIRHNTFTDVYESSIIIKNGTSGIRIDSNRFEVSVLGGSLNIPKKSIVFSYLADTSYLTGNTFYYRTPCHDSEEIAIQLAPVTASPVNGYCLITNNFISYTSSYGSDGHNIFYAPGIDLSTRLPAIDISGTGPVHAGIYHNTIRFVPSYDPDSNQVARSALFRYNNTNSANDVRVLNNLFINKRTGGGAGSEHLSMQLLNTAGIICDYNIYSSGSSIRTGTTLHRSFSAYRAAYPAMDIHSSDADISFDALTGDILSATMYNNPVLRGTLLTAVPADKYDHTRTFPYKGTYEITPACSSGTFGVVISASDDSICAGKKNVLLSYRPLTGNTGVLHQWQQYDAGRTMFTDIPGAISRDLLTTPIVQTTYRMKDSCVGGSGLVRYSNQVVVNTRTDGLIGGITETHVDADYQFILSGTTSAFHSWVFGDGTSSVLTGNTQSHTYARPGFYKVSVISKDYCEGEASLTVYVNTTGINTPANAAAYRIYPNPATNMLSLEAPDKIKELVLTDQFGRTVWSGSVNSNHTAIDVSPYRAGYYYLRIISTGGVLCRPVTIVR